MAGIIQPSLHLLGDRQFQQFTDSEEGVIPRKLPLGIFFAGNPGFLLPAVVEMTNRELPGLYLLKKLGKCTGNGRTDPWIPCTLTLGPAHFYT